MIWHFWKKDKSGLFKNKNIFSSWKSWYNPARWKTNFHILFYSTLAKKKQLKTNLVLFWDNAEYLGLFLAWTCNALLVSIGKDLSCCCGKYLLSCILSPKSKKTRKYHYTFWQIQLQQVLKKQEFFFKCCLAKQDKMKEWCHFLLHQLDTIVKMNHYQR